MHPAILQELAAEHIKTMIAEADNARRARQARHARRARTPGPLARPAPPGRSIMPGESGHLSPACAVGAVPGQHLARSGRVTDAATGHPVSVHEHAPETGQHAEVSSRPCEPRLAPSQPRAMDMAGQ